MKGSKITKIKMKISGIFALYLSFSRMAYIAFCHETLHLAIVKFKWERP